MEKITDEFKCQSMNFFGNGVIPMIPDKKDIEFLSAIDNSNIEMLRKYERFNTLVTSLIKLFEEENKNITREETEILAIDILGGYKMTSKNESEKDSIDKFIELSNEIVDNYIQKHR